MDPSQVYIITHEHEIKEEFLVGCTKELTEIGFKVVKESTKNATTTLHATKKERLTLIDSQTQIIALYAKKYDGNYVGWNVS